MQRIKIPPKKQGLWCVIFYILMTLCLVLFNYKNIFDFLKLKEKSWTWWLSWTAVPIYEEVFFRIVIPEALKKSLPQVSFFWILYLSILLFWIFHSSGNGQMWLVALQNFQVPIPLGPLILGILTMGLTLYENSIFSAVLLHSAVNSLGVVWVRILPWAWLEGLFFY